MPPEYVPIFSLYISNKYVLCDKDIEIANRYGLDYTGGPNNGIALGMRNNANYLGTDYVLFLENDCPTIASPPEVQRELAIAIDYLMNGKIKASSPGSSAFKRKLSPSLTPAA
jgi:hypothetical protein